MAKSITPDRYIEIYIILLKSVCIGYFIKASIEYLNDLIYIRIKWWKQ